MVHTRVSDECINFALMEPTDNIFTVLPIKHLLNQYVEPTTPHTMATGTKPSVSNICVLFCSCVVLKATEYVDTKALNIRHQSQKYFGVSLLEFNNIKKFTSSTYLVHGE